MRLPSILVSLTFISLAVTQETVDKFKAVLSDLQSKIQVLNTAVGSLSATSTAVDFAKLVTFGDGIAATSKAGYKDILSGTAISIMNAINLTSDYDKMYSLGTTLGSTFIDKKDVLLQANQKDMVLTLLGIVKASIYNIENAMRDSLPVSFGLGSGIRHVDPLKKAIEAFS
jgi:hypothetical protein